MGYTKEGWVSEKNRYGDHRHPVHHVFFTAKMSMKTEEELKEFFSKINNGFAIRTKRTREGTKFMCSQFKQVQMIQYCFDHFTELMDRFEMTDTEVDYSVIQEKRGELS